jgi:hypothetical protein
MIENEMSRIYDIRWIDDYNRFYNASLQRDHLERTLMAISVIVLCCGLLAQVEDQNESHASIVLSSLVIMTGVCTMHRITRILEHTRFIRF